MPKLDKRMSRAQDRALRTAAMRYKGIRNEGLAMRRNAVGLSQDMTNVMMRPWTIVYRERKGGKVRLFSYSKLPPGAYSIRMVDTYIDTFCRLVQVVELV